jgi:hypothetical protein
MGIQLPERGSRWISCAVLILVLAFLTACNSGISDTSDGGGNTAGDNGDTNTDNTGDNTGGGSDPGGTGGGSDPGGTGSGSDPGGTGGGSGTINTDVAVACTSSGDDSTQNPDGSASFVRSYTIDSPVYHSVVSRKDYLNRNIWLDYMLHEPTTMPKGIVVLIAGGAMNAAIYGTEGNTATHSGKNYLVRSAHRYMQAGYRVITMDRPRDFSKYGDIDSAGYLYDTYRTSVDHAVDITTIVNRENSEDLPVFIAGTSRGAISAVAQNSLSAGIDISSPVTAGSGTPVGTDSLPETQVQVPVHLLYHQTDTCTVSPTTSSALLFDQLLTAGIDVQGNNVSGGFADTVANNPCGALDYHGFTGIENCAVNTSTTWMDNELAAMESQHPGNARPVAQNMTVNDLMGQPIDITLFVTDRDDTTFTYGLPYATSSLGGTLTISDNTVHYVAPNNDLPAMTTDKFVYTVIDSKGSRSAAVVSVDLSQATVDHTDPGLAACSSCHTPPAGHISVISECGACHTTTQWPGQPFDHASFTQGCSTCHDGVIASGKSSGHIDTTEECNVCHASTTDWLIISNN